MDSGLPDRSVEENMEDGGASVDEALDHNVLHIKVQPIEEAMNDIGEAELNKEDSGSTVLSVGFEHAPSPPSDRCDDVDRDDADKRSSYYTEGLRSPVDDYRTRNEKEGEYYVGVSSEVLDTDDNETFNNKVETEALDPLGDNPLQEIDDKHACEIVVNKDFDHQASISPVSIELLDGDSGNGEKSLKAEKGEIETKEGYDSPGVIPSHNGRVEGEYSVPQSPQGTRNAARSQERQLSLSPERSPRAKHSTKQHDRRSPAPSPSKRKRSPSPAKHDVGHKRASSRDRSSPSLRRRSPSDRTAQRDSHRRGSPRKRLSVSPRRRESPRRRDRSASRSPVRRRESSGHRRDHRGRSRSRSPYSRDSHRISPRRKHSPRRRSPPSSYHSRRRSPRRPWSPPPNRNTGIGRPGNNLFVAGFSYGTTEKDLERKFSKFGRVTDVRVVREKRSGDSRGFGFISFEKDEDADAAIRAIDQTEWNGRIVLVEKSKTALR